MDFNGYNGHFSGSQCIFSLARMVSGSSVGESDQLVKMTQSAQLLKKMSMTPTVNLEYVVSKWIAKFSIQLEIRH